MLWPQPSAVAMQKPRGDLLAVNALWMVGHVQSVLACEIHLQSLNTKDCFRAANHHVHPDVFSQLGGPLAYLLGPLVAFQADDRPGVHEAEGFRRARYVQLASSAASSFWDVNVGMDPAMQRPGPDPSLSGSRLLGCPTVKSSVLEWRELLKSRNQADVRAQQVQLQEVFNQGAEEEEGGRLCEVLLCCLAGLLALSEVRPCQRDRDPERHADWLRDCWADLLQLANGCWGALDLKDRGTQQRLGAAQPLCRHLAEQGTGNEWQRFADFVEACFSQRPVSQRRPLHGTCEIKDCKRRAERMLFRDDVHGPAGYRCAHHGGRLPCTVSGCKRQTDGAVDEDDHLGPAGYRCNLHGARCCNVKGCNRLAKLRSPTDHLAPAGRRCPQHLPVWPRASPSATLACFLVCFVCGQPAFLCGSLPRSPVLASGMQRSWLQNLAAWQGDCSRCPRPGRAPVFHSWRWLQRDWMLAEKLGHCAKPLKAIWLCIIV